jgi:hypothetical protein
MHHVVFPSKKSSGRLLALSLWGEVWPIAQNSTDSFSGQASWLDASRFFYSPARPARLRNNRKAISLS